MSDFSNNNAVGNGGALFLNQVLNTADINDSVFENNTATSGGAMYASSGNIILFTGVNQISNNVGKLSGGAIFTDNSNIVFYDTAYFVNNRCEGSFCIGGVIAATRDSIIAFTGLFHTFTRNYASLFGGAVFLSQSFMKVINVAMLFEENIASQGSAWYLDHTIGNKVLITQKKQITFKRNVCTSGGGTVFWISDPRYSESVLWEVDDYTNPYDSTRDYSLAYALHFMDNQAVFAPNMSTQTTTLSFTSTESITITQYGRVVDNIPLLQMLDYFGNLNTTDYSTLITATTLNYSCSGRVGYLQGMTSTMVRRGQATFRNMSVSCFPGGRMWISFAAQQEGFAKDLNVQNILEFKFRNCIDGEVLVNNECLMCPTGSYSLQYIGEKTVCKECPSGSADCYGNVILLEPGYWRVSP